MDNVLLYHPALRSRSADWIDPRSSVWSRWWYPAAERISWCGDIRLYCTAEQYQQVLDAVPGAVTVGTGEDRTTDPNWQGLDDYRARVLFWLRQFDERGNVIGQEPVANLAPPPPVGSRMSRWLRRGRP
jgi:hypothetical protein